VRRADWPALPLPVDSGADSAPDWEAQLARYASDFREVARRERAASRRSDALLAQIQTYADAVRKMLQEERESRHELEQAYDDTLLRLARAIGVRDRVTGQHAERLSYYARIVAMHLGLEDEAVEQITRAAPLHDLGKIGIPDAILLKPAPLDESEWKVMRTHCGIGASLLRGEVSPRFEVARAIALAHHEHWDGSGYPQGLSGEEIPLAARIVMLADVYDSLRSTRPGKAPLSHDAAHRVLTEGDGRTHPQHFDPRILEAFTVLHDRFAEGFRVLGGE
jgi:putative two-component system response regulator